MDSDIFHLPAGRALERSVSLCPEKTALVYRGERISYEELNRRVDAFAAGITSLGFGKGGRFVIDLPNSPELVIAFYAFARLGIITTW
jgi:acyl-CoA synthetase (AMP-forming)/AMP-acid ligase II